MTKEFDKPLNEWVQEEIEIATIEPVLNEKHEVVGLKHGKRKAYEKTMYVNAPETSVDCGKGSHMWHIPDKHKHVAFCKKCPKRRLIRAVYERVIEGKIVDRDSGELID